MDDFILTDNTDSIPELSENSTYQTDDFQVPRSNSDTETNNYGKVHVPNFEGVSGSEDRGGGDSSIQFTNFGRVGDKSFKEWRQKIEG